MNAADPFNGEAIIETNAVDRRRQLCRCSMCGVVSRCTPRNDFYSDGDGSNPNSLLKCERCVVIVP